MLVGLRAGQRLLDVGCGAGRLARGLQGWFGEGYVGVDIMPELIDYCRKAYPNFRFDLLDLESDLYNPGPTTSANTVRLDLDDASFDCITFFSVFTHTTTEMTRGYLEETRRLLAPDGSLYFTCFLLNEAQAQAPAPAHRFSHRYDDGCFYEDDQIVSAAVAYRQEVMLRMLEDAGLGAVFLETGTWTGRLGLSYQDTIIAQRREDLDTR